MAKQTEAELVLQLQNRMKKKFGSASVSALGSDASHAEVPSGISTQSLCLDLALGRPGIPAGRIVEVSGLESVGKSLIGFQLLAEVQRIQGISILVDAEMGLDLSFVQKIGVALGPSVIVLQPPYMEAGFDMIEDTVTTIRDAYPERALFCLYDSIAGCPTKVELEKGYVDANVAPHAKFLSPAMRKLMDLCAHTKLSLLLINQLRDRIGVYGSGPDSFGGKAIRFHMSMRLRLKRTEMLKEGTEIVGIQTKVQVIKNKLANPYKTAEMNFYFRSGLDRHNDLIKAAALIGEAVESDSGWYTVAGQEKKLQRPDYRELIDTDLGGVEKYKERLTQIAIERGMILPYGVPLPTENATSLSDGAGNGSSGTPPKKSQRKKKK
jgi:recombination protein RecA